MTFKTIDTTDLRNNLSEVIDSVKSGETIIVKKRGKMRVVMVDLDDYEDLLAVSDPEYVKSIVEARAEKTFHTPEEVFGDLW